MLCGRELCNTHFKSICVYAYTHTYLLYNEKNFLIFSQFTPDVIKSALETDCEQTHEESLGNKCAVLCLCKNGINSDVNEWIVFPYTQVQRTVNEHQ